MSFKRLHQECFDSEHDGDERQSIGQDSRDVEQLEGNADLKTHAVRPAQQFDDQHDFPHQRQAGPRGRGEIRRQLRQDDVAQPLPSAHTKYRRHLVEIAIQGARAFTDRNGGERQLVEDDGCKRRPVDRCLVSGKVRAKAVRLVRDHVDEYGSEWEAIKTVSSRLAMHAETLRTWIRQAQVDEGDAEG